MSYNYDMNTTSASAFINTQQYAKGRKKPSKGKKKLRKGKA